LLGVGVIEHAHDILGGAPGGWIPERRSGSYADLVAATARFSWPSARDFMTVYAQILTAADRF
ncbi:MAG: hypothetical protein ACRDJY_07935, partial [Thermoleophilaceae bacterium]